MAAKKQAMATPVPAVAVTSTPAAMATPAAPATPAEPAAPTTLAPGSKEARLAELLQLYKADRITPTEYHEQRAKIIAEP